ncbi:MAG: N-glycosylase [Thermoplasmatales archaeon SG8-52-3]|nr:MAG: N-glycosylase [Thermoplasmatales archaeon SG8-52-3]
MNELINKIENLKHSEIANIIDKRIEDFKKIDKNSNEELFKEICFCLLTANYNAEKSIKIQKEIGDCFLTDSKEELTKKLRNYGHRFPNARAEYIQDSLNCKDKLKEVIQFPDKKALRDWIVNNVKGIGYKEASHFLRNVGFDDYAIIDFHIIDILVNNNIINRPKTLTKKRYFEIEDVLRRLAKKTDLTLAELDLYLWYLETGKILK